MINFIVQQQIMHSRKEMQLNANLFVDGIKLQTRVHIKSNEATYLVFVTTPERGNKKA